MKNRNLFNCILKKIRNFPPSSIPQHGLASRRSCIIYTCCVSIWENCLHFKLGSNEVTAGGKIVVHYLPVKNNHICRPLLIVGRFRHLVRLRWEKVHLETEAKSRGHQVSPDVEKKLLVLDSVWGNICVVPWRKICPLCKDTQRTSRAIPK